MHGRMVVADEVRNMSRSWLDDSSFLQQREIPLLAALNPRGVASTSSSARLFASFHGDDEWPTERVMIVRNILRNVFMSQCYGETQSATCRMVLRESSLSE